MTGPEQYGDLVPSRSQEIGTVASLHGVVARIDLPSSRSPSPVADPSNIIPFAPGRRQGVEPCTPPVIIGPDDRPAPPAPGTSVVKQIALVACSLAAHGLLLFAFWEEPRPLASIGIDAITVEIVVGDNRPAGLAPTPGENEVQAAPPAEEVKPDDRPIEQQEQRIAEAREVAPEEKQTEVAADQPVEQPKDQPPEKRDEFAMVKTPEAVTPTAPPRDTPPDMHAVMTPSREQPKEVTPDDPKQPVQKKAEKKDTEQKKATRPAPSVASNAASGAGKRSVAADPNYNGRVAAHLARHKQYPAAARSNGTQGVGTVTFSINGSGSVTSVSIARGTGAAILDQELTAMVRRASPFPAPPDGQAKSFTVPVSFKLN
jgi:protein TonB